MISGLRFVFTVAMMLTVLDAVSSAAVLKNAEKNDTPAVLKHGKQIWFVTNSSGFAYFKLEMVNVARNVTKITARFDGMSFIANLKESSFRRWRQTVVFRTKLSSSSLKAAQRSGTVRNVVDLTVRVVTEKKKEILASVPESMQFQFWEEDELRNHLKSIILMTVAILAGVVLLTTSTAVVGITIIRKHNIAKEEKKAQQSLQSQPSLYEPIRISRDVYGRGSIVIPAEK